jgi:protein-tyrosine kinase
MERIQSAIAKGRAARQNLPAVTNPQVHLPVTRKEDEAAKAWAALAEMPLDRMHLETARVVAHEPGLAASPYDMMRTNLMRAMRDHGWTRVGITSPSSSCGKTTTCVNLAFSLARQSELRVMVLELDMRRPAMMKTLGIGGGKGFAAVLDGSASAEAGLVKVWPNLAFGLNRGPVANASELLASTQAGAAIDAIEAKFKPDIILFDMPPMLVIDDTMAFLDQTDCALLIAASEQSTVAEIDKAGKELASHTSVLGVVLNKCRYMDKGEGYGYGAY